MMNKKDINVKLNGKEYLELLKYEDSKKFVWTKENKRIGTLLAGITIVSAFLTIIVDILTPSTHTPFNFTMEGLLVFLVICLGFSWIIHGVGFLLVRR